MKVLQVGGLAGPGASAGGVWAVATTQAEALREAGTEIRLVGTWLGRAPDDFKPEATLLRAFRPFPGAALRALVVPGIFRLVHEVRRADVIHIHLSRDLFTSVVLLMGRLGRKPIVVQAHGMIRRSNSVAIRTFDLIFRPLYLHFPRLWLSLTNEETAGLVEFGVEEGCIIHVENASSARQLPETERDVDALPLFVFISRLHPRKQPDVFAEAAHLLLGAGYLASFRIVGPDQGAEKRARSVAADGPARHHIVFVGAVDAAGVMAEISAATAVVLPSVGEVAPMIAIETAAAGKPLVLTDDCGLAPLFESHDAGLVVPPEPASIAAAMKAVIEDKGLAERVGSNARRLHASRWSTEALASELLRLYASISPGQGRSR